jgi:hypothetical protein
VKIFHLNDLNMVYSFVPDGIPSCFGLLLLYLSTTIIYLSKNNYGGNESVGTPTSF